MGIQEDTNMKGDQFSYMALVFYITYLAFELPTGYLMQRLPLAKYLGFNVAAWGLMSENLVTVFNQQNLTVKQLRAHAPPTILPPLSHLELFWDASRPP